MGQTVSYTIGSEVVVNGKTYTVVKYQRVNSHWEAVLQRNTDGKKINVACVALEVKSA